uniref:Uncharacterized protein n=1 Tax=Setaria italica TaxID=4555 RepID=K3Z1Q6_SETIT
MEAATDSVDAIAVVVLLCTMGWELGRKPSCLAADLLLGRLGALSWCRARDVGNFSYTK